MSRLAERDAALKAALDAVRARADLRARRGADPVSLVHRYASRDDREIVALVAAACAFGNVKAILLKLEDLFGRLGESPARAADDPRRVRRALRGWKHRLFTDDDVTRLLVGARRVQREAGSLGAAFREALAAADGAIEDRPAAFREALAAFCERIRAAGALHAEKGRGARRGPSHILPDPRAGSAGKRLFLFLRWMIREDDGIDLGLWDVDPARLLVPVDVHIHKLARNVGLTRRADLSWKTAVEITAGLARFDPKDPTRYDFSLCHMGMVQRCPSRRDPARCEGCGVRPVCVHWKERRDIPRRSVRA